MTIEDLHSYIKPSLRSARKLKRYTNSTYGVSELIKIKPKSKSMSRMLTSINIKNLRIDLTENKTEKRSKKRFSAAGYCGLNREPYNVRNKKSSKQLPYKLVTKISYRSNISNGLKSNKKLDFKKMNTLGM